MDSHDPIAVVGMAGLFPGSVSLELFWQNIINGIDVSGEVCPERWNVDPDLMISADPRPDKAYSRRCCPITDFEFDASGIELDPELAVRLDPLYHFVLHVGREALSGLPEASINRERTGVILAAIALPTDSTSAVTRDVIGAALEEKLFGVGAPDRKDTGLKPLSRSQYLASRVTSLPAAILAKAFGLGGGTYTLDAACASSLYSVKLACDELHSHRADVMLAGGVSRPNSLFTQVGFSQLRALSPSGRCAPFDQDADGLVVGEGAGMVVLKRWADAVHDQDPICGLIHGVGLSNDMRGNLLAPDSEGQLRAMRKVYQSSGWSPRDIDLIECHGAGTPLGDQTELNSLKQLWGDSGWSRAQCAIGSVKSMIGHLLTAAGAAGMIKTLLALKHKTLPPSLNFKKAPQNSPLNDGPFRVLTRSESWPAPIPDRPRRAAVSAFGFGGINAHMLLEEFDGNSDCGLRIADCEKTTIEIQSSDSTASDLAEGQDESSAKTAGKKPESEIAIVGMEASFGSATSLRKFQELIFNGRSNISDRPRHRWKGCDPLAERHLKTQSLPGGFVDELSITAGEFQIPPKEIPDILPQQLLMLKVAAGAVMDAGLPLRQDRPDMGTIIGIDFDIEAANYHLRWHLSGAIDQGIETPGWRPEHPEKNKWLMSMMDSCSRPLTASRTLGALGGIVASRVAREFRLGGPSFVVSCEDAGGIKALEIGVRALQQDEAEAFLIGAVDLGGDVRNLILADGVRSFSRSRRVRPFDNAADGTLPGEGAAALIIKRLDRALADGDRIYSVIKGIGGASGGRIDTDFPDRETYLRSLEKSCREARIPPAAISLVESHGSGNPVEDDLESEALNNFFGRRRVPCAVSSTKPAIGHTGAASALASLVKASLCLYQEILPPLTGFTAPKNPLWLEDRFHFPIHPQYWLRDRCDGPRTAVIGSMTPDGNCAHVVVQGYEYRRLHGGQAEVLEKVKRERQRPLGLQNFALFAVDGPDREAVLAGLNALQQHIDRNLTASVDGRESAPAANIEEIARTWYLANGADHAHKCAVAIAAADAADLINWISEARQAIRSNKALRIGKTGGVHYAPHPMGHTGELAFVFPGSGNHYLGMGRDIGIQWPRILREMDARTSRLKTQLIPECYVPWRASWEAGWQSHAYQNIVSESHHMIFGQVVHGGGNGRPDTSFRSSSVSGNRL